MPDLLYYILIAASSIAILIFSADLAIGGIANYAKKLGISDFLIGFIVVGIGTSLPEFVSSFAGAQVGEGGIVFGTLLGSIIGSYCLVLGIPAIIKKHIPISDNVRKRKNWPILLISLIFIILSIDEKLSRTDGLILILTYVIYLILLWKKEGTLGKLKKDIKLKHIYRDSIVFLGSLVALLLSARWLVFSSVKVSREFLGIEPYLLAITVIGIVGILPDIIVELRSIYKGHAQIGMGNVLGSSIINFTIIPAIVIIINPITISFKMILPAFIAAFLLISIVLKIIKKGIFLRKHGIYLVSIWVLFMLYQILLYA